MIIKQVYEVDGVNWSGDNGNRDGRRAVTNMTLLHSMIVCTQRLRAKEETTLSSNVK